ncbi:type I-E CRISPR-associated protein Cse2/CasB [Phenylobacterium sp.]|uniref:type I-E CRISPR-associated protein Cse2/CasB n=1 Tax=Phenylobacterium sp. TaxID=1871053 RepID=UPI00301B8BA6
MSETPDWTLRRDLARTFWLWWEQLRNPKDARGPDRAALARLRRIDRVATVDGRPPDVLAALCEPAFRDLCAAVEPLRSLGRFEDERVEELVAAAAAVVRVRERASGPVARALGGAKVEERRMSEGRFLTLLRVETTGDLFDQACRLGDLLEGGADVGDLGASIFLWRSRRSVRSAWARDYYHIHPGGPPTKEPPTREPPAGPAGATGDDPP